jgi:hypothetical protein
MLLSVGSATPVGNVAHFENSTGSCYINPTTASLSYSSDARLKTNINVLTASSGIEAFRQLNPVTYNWLTEANSTPLPFNSGSRRHAIDTRSSGTGKAPYLAALVASSCSRAAIGRSGSPSLGWLSCAGGPICEADEPGLVHT